MRHLNDDLTRTWSALDRDCAAKPRHDIEWDDHRWNGCAASSPSYSAARPKAAGCSDARLIEIGLAFATTVFTSFQAANAFEVRPPHQQMSRRLEERATICRLLRIRRVARRSEHD
jgi:hypothetical protein